MLQFLRVAQQLLLELLFFWQPVHFFFHLQMANKKPLFQGDSEIDELFRIFRIMRTPTEDIWPGVTQLPDFKATFPAWTSYSLPETVNQGWHWFITIA